MLTSYSKESVYLPTLKKLFQKNTCNDIGVSSCKCGNKQCLNVTLKTSQGTQEKCSHESTHLS